MKQIILTREIEEPIIQSTAEQLREFKEGFIWNDICNELAIWLEDVTSLFMANARELLDGEISGGTANAKTGAASGRAETIVNVLGIVDALISTVEDEKRDKQAKEAGQTINNFELKEDSEDE